MITRGTALFGLIQSEIDVNGMELVVDVQLPSHTRPAKIEDRMCTSSSTPYLR